MIGDLTAAFDQLRGKTLWDSGRAVEMRKFGFGDKRVLPNRKGRVAGEWELHVQCAWRLTCGETILVGSTDAYLPVAEDQAARWDTEGGNISDVRCTEIFAGTEFKVLAVDMDHVGGLSVRMTDGMVLETWTNSWNGEQWRLFVPRTITSHYVVSTADGKVIARIE